MDSEELAEQARRTRRKQFRVAMRKLIRGNEAERLNNVRDWKPISDLVNDRYREDPDEEGEHGIVNV